MMEERVGSWEKLKRGRAQGLNQISIPLIRILGIKNIKIFSNMKYTLTVNKLLLRNSD